MTPTFTINFRRQEALHETARRRQRLLSLGGWLVYFGILAILMGLYGLNLTNLSDRAAALERKTALPGPSARAAAAAGRPEPAELAAVERFQANPRRWRNRLVRLSELLPDNVALSSISLIPDNLSAPGDDGRLTIVGELRAPAGHDPLGAVVRLVSALQGDSVFASGFEGVRLDQSRASVGPPAATEFVITCR